MRHICAVIGVVLVSASALAVLGPEVPLAPAQNPGASQLQVRIASAGGHTLAVWSDGQLRGWLDGMPIDLTVAGPPSAVIGACGGNNSFLVVYQADIQTSPYNMPVLALRIGFDGRVLDPAPITVDVDTHGHWGGNVAFDGTGFVVVTMEKHSYPSIIWAETIVTGRVSEDGVPGGNVRLTSSATSGYPRWPRIAWAVDHFVIGYDAVFFGSEGISNFGMSVTSLQPQESGNRVLPDSQFPDTRSDSPQPSVAVGYDRVTLAWMNVQLSGATIVIAQTDLQGEVLLPPTVVTAVKPPPALLGGTDVEIAWDGKVYLIAWTSADGPSPDPLDAIRIGYDGKPLDGQPFEVTPASSSDFSVTPLPQGGFAIGYSNRIGTTFRAFLRTIDRPSVPQRRRAAR